MTWNTERAVLGWLEDHPAGGTAHHIALTLQVPYSTVTAVLYGLAKAEFATRDGGVPPTWKINHPEWDHP